MKTTEALALAREIAGSWDWVTEVVQPEDNRLDIYLGHPEDLVAIVTAFRVKRLGYLAAITGLDPGVDVGELEVLYHFCAGAAVMTLRVRVPREAARVDSLSELIPGAEPFERELREMFGVTVHGLQAPEHLYLPDEWPAAAFPLRKDFDAAVLESGKGSKKET